MFINLSNHPLSTWSDQQLEAARTYGELEEIAFPNIGSHLTGIQVRTLAASFVANILAHYPAGNLTVHVMGELTFCHHAVSLLKAAGIRCVASTSERTVEELGEGKKVVQFGFVRFREY